MTKLTPLMLTAGKEARQLSLAPASRASRSSIRRIPGSSRSRRRLIDKRRQGQRRVSATGVTALLLAAAHNNAPIVGLLAESGADKSAKTP